MVESKTPPPELEATPLSPLEMLAQIRVMALTDDDLDRLFRTSLVSLSRALDGAPVAVHQYDPGDDSLVVVCDFNWSDVPDPMPVPHDFGHLSLDDLAGIFEFADSGADLMDPEGARSMSAIPGSGLATDFEWPVDGHTVPIWGREHPYGTLSVGPSARLTRVDLRFLQNLANLLATAILHRAAERETRQSRDELAVILEGIADGITAQSPSGALVYANSAAAKLIGFESADALLNADLSAVLDRFEVYDEAGNTFDLGALPGRLALAGKEPEPVLLRYRVKATGEERWSYTRARPIYGADGQVVLSVNMFQDVTDLKRNERYHQLLSRAGDLLSQGLDPEKRLARVAELVVPDIAEWCVVDLLESDGAFRNVALAHRDPRQVAGARALRERYPPDRDGSAQRQVATSGESLLIREVTPDMIRAGAANEDHAAQLIAAGIRSVMIVPLLRRGEPLGTLTLLNTRSGPVFGPEDLEHAEELARRVALSVDNARLYVETVRLNESLEQMVARRTSQLEKMLRRVQDEVAERQRAQAELSETQRRLLDSREDERLLLAQELHDGAIQELYGLAMQLERTLNSAADPDLPQVAEEMFATVKSVMTELRGICTDLRPPALTAFGLAPALRSHVDRVASEHRGVAFEMALDDDGQQLSEGVRLALYRIAQEGINNALRHGGAERIQVGLRVSEAETRLTIEDDGVGFDPPERLLEWVRAGHLGLAGANERAESLGGALSLDSAPGRGTRLEALIPLGGQSSDTGNASG